MIIFRTFTPLCQLFCIFRIAYILHCIHCAHYIQDCGKGGKGVGELHREGSGRDIGNYPYIPYTLYDSCLHMVYMAHI